MRDTWKRGKARQEKLRLEALGQTPEEVFG